MTTILKIAMFTCYMLIRLQSEEKDKLEAKGDWAYCDFICAYKRHT